MSSTQDHLPIQDIKDDVLILKDGSMAVLLQTSAVNFGLLSENEQLAIISSFAGLLNSLSFAIQIVIRSKRLDITNYLKTLDGAQRKQTNPLLFKMIDRYRAFIRETVRENEVLDKQFYIVIPLSYLEIGLRKNSPENFKKAMTILFPRRDHIIRQLARCGISAKQLDTEALVKLFYDIYNPVEIKIAPEPQQAQAQPQAQVQTPQPARTQPLPTTQPQSSNVPHIEPPLPKPQQVQQPATPSPYQRRTPFVVEELPDEYVRP